MTTYRVRAGETRSVGTPKFSGFRKWRSRMVAAMLLPEASSRLLTRLLSGQDMSGGWIIVQHGVYCYAALTHRKDIAVRRVVHEYSATEVIWS